MKHNLSLDLGFGMEKSGSRYPGSATLEQTMWYSYLHLDGDLLLYLDLLNHGGAADVEDAARIDPHLQLDLLIAPLRGRLHLAWAHRRVMTAPGIQNPLLRVQIYEIRTGITSFGHCCGSGTVIIGIFYPGVGIRNKLFQIPDLGSRIPNLPYIFLEA